MNIDATVTAISLGKSKEITSGAVTKGFVTRFETEGEELHINGSKSFELFAQEKPEWVVGQKVLVNIGIKS